MEDIIVEQLIQPVALQPQDNREDITVIEELITLPENTTEEYDGILYIEDNPAELNKAPTTVADYLWRVINYHLQSPEQAAKQGQTYSYPDRVATQLCYARGLLSDKFGYGRVYRDSQTHLFSLDTKRDSMTHFDDCGSLEQQQGARFMYGYLAYLVALDEGK